MTGFRVHDVRLAPALPSDRSRGLLGYISCTIGDLRIDGLTLRRTRQGRYSISLPMRRGHAIVRPLKARGIRELERQILAVLGEELAL